MAGTADRSVTARAFCFPVEVFGVPESFLTRGVSLLHDSAELFWVFVWLERLRLATARAQGGFLHVLRNCRLLVLPSQEYVLVGRWRHSVKSLQKCAA